MIKIPRSRFIGITEKKHSQFTNFISCFHSSRKSEEQEGALNRGQRRGPNWGPAEGQTRSPGKGSTFEFFFLFIKSIVLWRSCCHCCVVVLVARGAVAQNSFQGLDFDG